MRFPCFYILLILVITGCHLKENNTANRKTNSEQTAILKDTANFTSIQWLDSTHRDFGKIVEGQKLEVSFRFRNSGDKPLVITRVQASCGCTIAEQPTVPITAGGEGIIKASFNSEDRTGVNHKTLYVIANTKGSSSNELHFVVEVEKKKW